jgi:hypothetical protein
MKCSTDHTVEIMHVCLSHRFKAAGLSLRSTLSCAAASWAARCGRGAAVRPTTYRRACLCVPKRAHATNLVAGRDWRKADGSVCRRVTAKRAHRATRARTIRRILGACNADTFPAVFSRRTALCPADRLPRRAAPMTLTICTGESACAADLAAGGQIWVVASYVVAGRRYSARSRTRLGSMNVNGLTEYADAGGGKVIAS